MNTSLILRDFTAEDVSPANQLTNWFIEHSAVHFGSEAASDAEFAALWEKGRASFPWLSAVLDGVFVGYCKAGPWRERAAYARTVETGIYVCEQARGQGVGKALYAEMFSRLRLLGLRVVVAGITLPNEASVRLHEGVGFQLAGVFRAVGLKFNAWHDVGFWQLDLGV
jgi:phosphinothricin acetyltransferase